MGTSFEQFKAVLRSDYARHAIGLDISANEAERVASDPVLARAYYDNWLRLGSKAAPKPPASSGMDGHTALPRHSMPAPVAYAGAQPLRDFETSVPASSASDTDEHKLGLSITGLVLSVVGYFLTSTWFSILGLIGLVLSIHAILAARQAKPRQGWKAGLTLGIIGTVAGGAALILFIAALSGYYN